jgi:hypothetical protein
MTGTEIYKRTDTYEAKAKEIKLHAPHWKLLLAYDGQRSLSEVALSAEISFADALPLTQKFLDEDWIAEQPITLDQYLKRIGTKDIAPGAAVAPPTVLHEPGQPTASTAATPAPVAPAVSAPQASTPRPPAIQAPPPLPPSVRLGTPAVATAVPPLKSTGRSMKLSAVVDFITSLVGNIAIGQILVYRVFLRVPPELLMAEDIASVYLVNDSSLITGEKLQKAIADAVNAVTKKMLPDSVYAAA